MNSLDEPGFIAVSKPLLTEFGIHHRLERCELEFLVSLNLAERVLNENGLHNSDVI